MDITQLITNLSMATPDTALVIMVGYTVNHIISVIGDYMITKLKLTYSVDEESGTTDSPILSEA